MKKRINVVTAINSKNIVKSGNTITIRDVVPVVDDIVMNGLLYSGDECLKGVNSLEQVPAPANHPLDDKGNFISAKAGEAMTKHWIGAYVHNARHADGKTYCDISVNVDQANAMEKGRMFLERLNAAMGGEAVEPIHVSTGLYLNMVEAEGYSMGKKYRGMATNIEYDHLAILLDQEGAGTPSQGVGMFLNAAGEQQEVETVTLEINSEKSPMFERAIKWLGKLFGNEELSFYQTMEKLQEIIGGERWIVECYAKEFIYAEGDKKYKQEYFISEEGEVSLIGDAVEVARKVEYEEVATNHEENHMKEQILAALNAAGVSVEGLTDAQILTAYNSVVTKPIQDKLAAANSKVAEFEQKERAVVELEVNELATKLAVNSVLTVDDLKALPVERLRELSKSAAPIAVGNAQEQKANEWADYDLNALLETK